MNARNKIASLVGGAAVLATAVGMTGGLAPAAAAPKQDGATLSIVDDRLYPKNYLVTVSGNFPMEQADAQGFLNNLNTGKCKGGLSYYIQADDGNSHPNYIYDERYWGEYANVRGHWSATPKGMSYLHEFTVPKSKFNEDDGLFDDTDEIYAQVSFNDGDCGIRIQTSQVISRVL